VRACRAGDHNVGHHHYYDHHNTPQLHSGQSNLHMSLRGAVRKRPRIVYPTMVLPRR